VDLTADDVGERLDRLRERPSGRWLVGIRALVQDEPDPDWLVRPEVLRGLRAVAARGLVFDLLIRPGQLPAAVAAVAAVPSGRYVLDHLAKPAIARGGWEPWASDLTRIAALPNVHAKLSGLVTEARWSAWHVHDLAPYAEHALEAFGPERLMFGSDWPVCTLASSYSGVIQAAEALLRGLSASEHSRVFAGTAQHVYSLCPGGGA
jgi:L-fuconolactonase